LKVVRTGGFTQAVDDYLVEHHTVTLSTSSVTGMPHANTALFVHDDGRISFLARRGSILLQNIRQSRRAAFTVDDYSSQWGKQRELHGDGRCEPTNEMDEARIRAMWSAKFNAPVPDGVLCDLTPTGLYFIEYHTDATEAEGV
jgi:hypothetical protein